MNKVKKARLKNDELTHSYNVHGKEISQSTLVYFFGAQMTCRCVYYMGIEHVHTYSSCACLCNVYVCVDGKEGGFWQSSRPCVWSCVSTQLFMEKQNDKKTESQRQTHKKTRYRKRALIMKLERRAQFASAAHTIPSFFFFVLISSSSSSSLAKIAEKNP